MDSSRDIVKKLRENRILNERTEYSNMDTKQLIDLAQSGDQLAIEYLVNTHQDLIGKMSHNIFLDGGDKDDVRQVATIAFWDAVKSWDGTGDFEAYAGMIIKRKLIDELRKDDTEKAKFNAEADSLDRPYADDGEGGEATVGDTLKSSSLSPEEQYLGQVGAQRIMDFLQNNLSENERNAIMLYIDGYKVSEIADKLELKYKSTENAIRRVKDKLAEYLKNVNESCKLCEGIFTDIEKDILKSVLNKIDGETEEIHEDVEEDDEFISESSAEDQLLDIRAELEGIQEEAKTEGGLPDDTVGDLKNRVSEIKDNINDLEQVIPNEDYILDLFNEVYDLARRVDRDLDDAYEHVDPYKYNGVSRDDF